MHLLSTEQIEVLESSYFEILHRTESNDFVSHELVKIDLSFDFGSEFMGVPMRDSVLNVVNLRRTLLLDSTPTNLHVVINVIFVQ